MRATRSLGTCGDNFYWCSLSTCDDQRGHVRIAEIQLPRLDGWGNGVCTASFGSGGGEPILFHTAFFLAEVYWRYSANWDDADCHRGQLVVRRSFFNFSSTAARRSAKHCCYGNNPQLHRFMALSDKSHAAHRESSALP